MECREARRIYAESINDQAPAEALDGAVREHLRDCPVCAGLLRRLVQVVAAPGGGCAVVRPRLLEYAEAEVRGAGNEPRFADVRLHLDLCVECALDFALLAESLAESLADGPEEAGQPATQMPAVDLSFLTGPAAPSVGERPGLGQLWETALRTEGPRRVVLQLSAALLAAAAVWPSPAARAMARSAAGAQQVWRLDVPGAHDALQITVTAEEQRRNPARIDLYFAVQDAARGWPELGGIEVECRWGEGEVQRAVTDAFGKAVAVGIPAEALAALSIVVDAQATA